MVNADDRRASSRQPDATSGSGAALAKRLAPTVGRNELGQTLIEFAFALPILLVILLVLVDFGLALDRRQMVQHAVREGARAGAVGAGLADIRETTAAPLGIDPARIEVCYVNVGGDPFPGEAGDDVRVFAKFTYQFAAGGGAFGLSPPEVEMTPSAQMRLEDYVPWATSC